MNIYIGVCSDCKTLYVKYIDEKKDQGTSNLASLCHTPNCYSRQFTSNNQNGYGVYVSCKYVQLNQKEYITNLLMKYQLEYKRQAEESIVSYTLPLTYLTAEELLSINKLIK